MEDWIETFTGKKFPVLSPRPEHVCIEDVAHALANTCRFSGHCKEFYSVAQHSVYVSDWCSGIPGAALQGLLHDASEAYLTDIPRPIKHILPDYRELEKKYERVIMQAFRLPFPMLEEIKLWDSLILKIEHRDVMNSTETWGVDELETIDLKILGFWSPIHAKERFLSRYRSLI